MLVPVSSIVLFSSLFTLSVAIVEQVPLLLSPFIKDGKVDVGKELSKVNPSYMLNVISYSGFITVDSEYNSNTFFWYFPVEDGQVENSSLAIWLQGGPMISSLHSLFQGVGPFYYEDGVLKENRFSWHKNQSVLFIDNPIGAGYSYTEDELGYATNQTQIGKNLYDFLIQFLQIFPELQAVPLFLTGQSYAGKHIPSLAYEIHTRNPTASLKINLKGMAIGNGWIDPPNTYKISGLLYQLGIIDVKTKLIVELMEKAVEDEISNGNWIAAKERHLDFLVYLVVEGHIRSPYNFITDERCYDMPEYIEFLTRNETKDALHVGNITYDWYNLEARKYLDGDFMKSGKHILEKLLDEYPVMLYNGQLDLMVPYVNSQNIYRSMNWSHSETYMNTSRDPWRFSSKQHGFLKIAGNLEEVLIRNAGHCVASEEPDMLEQLISAFIHGISRPSKRIY